MIRSMTGFGQKQAPWQDGSVMVEVRSVNHRFLEVACRLPRHLHALEDPFKKAVQQRCARGRVDITVSMQAGKGRGGIINLDQGLAKQYHQALRRLKTSLKLAGPIDVALIAGLRDVLTVSDQPLEDPQLATLVRELAEEALNQLQEMRSREGTTLAKDIQGRIQILKDHCLAVAEHAPTVTEENFDRMKQRIEKLMQAEMPDVPRLHQELAVYADRSDITEEIVRLDSHMLQFGEQLKR